MSGGDWFVIICVDVALLYLIVMWVTGGKQDR